MIYGLVIDILGPKTPSRGDNFTLLVFVHPSDFDLLVIIFKKPAFCPFSGQFGG